jgi:hypothetical protein
VLLLVQLLLPVWVQQPRLLEAELLLLCFLHLLAARLLLLLQGMLLLLVLLEGLLEAALKPHPSCADCWLLPAVLLPLLVLLALAASVMLLLLALRYHHPCHSTSRTPRHHLRLTAQACHPCRHLCCRHLQNLQHLLQAVRLLQAARFLQAVPVLQGRLPAALPRRLLLLVQRQAQLVPVLLLLVLLLALVWRVLRVLLQRCCWLQELQQAAVRVALLHTRLGLHHQHQAIQEAHHHRCLRDLQRSGAQEGRWPAAEAGRCWLCAPCRLLIAAAVTCTATASATATGRWCCRRPVGGAEAAALVSFVCVCNSEQEHDQGGRSGLQNELPRGTGQQLTCSSQAHSRLSGQDAHARNERMQLHS